MTKTSITTNKLATPAGPFPAAATFQNLAFISGQVGQDPATGKLVGDSLTEQAHQALRNLFVATEAAGGNKDTIVKINCYLLTMDDFASFNEVYKTYFEPGQCPARTCVAVYQLPLGAKVEVEAIATRDTNV
uniref:Endoribonuclease L-PSP, putative n=1 Tax=Providencia alcalifaciens Ban1 TaxID=663916 RepID=C9E4H1_9GAMM|nr:endoribonuclease L-PSP, putative [Providencia alcalifaciens Ban1]